MPLEGNSRACIIFVKFQYPEVFNSFKDIQGNFLSIIDKK